MHLLPRPLARSLEVLSIARVIASRAVEIVMNSAKSWWMDTVMTGLGAWMSPARSFTSMGATATFQMMIYICVTLWGLPTLALLQRAAAKMSILLQHTLPQVVTSPR